MDSVRTGRPLRPRRSVESLPGCARQASRGWPTSPGSTGSACPCTRRCGQTRGPLGLPGQGAHARTGESLGAHGSARRIPCRGHSTAQRARDRRSHPPAAGLRRRGLALVTPEFVSDTLPVDWLAATNLTTGAATWVPRKLPRCSGFRHSPACHGVHLRASNGELGCRLHQHDEDIEHPVGDLDRAVGGRDGVLRFLSCLMQITENPL